jgi:hypothetical protein
MALRLKLLILSLCFSLCVAAQEKKQPVISGWGWLTMGQVQSTQLESNLNYVDFDQKWLSDLQSGIKITAPVNSKSVCRIHVMGSLLYPVVDISVGAKQSEQLQKSFSFSILEASMQTNWSIGDNDTIFNRFGYFPVKYNPEAMNLGEYLFRSNAYPALLISGFELADKVKLAGINTGYRNHSRAGTYRADLYVNIETESYPTHDISLSALAGFATPKSFFDMSLGISFYHLIPFEEDRITPAEKRTEDGSRIYNFTNTSFVDSSGDTTNYTFRGGKAVARVAFDPKVFFPSRLLGKNDLKLYAEGAILGIKNYPGWYSDVRDRIPIMFGFNLPAFKILDVLAVEVEYFPNPYQNSYQFIWKGNCPVPYFTSYQTEIDYYSDWKRKTDDDWKWSIYASKKINNISISGQIASDHTSQASYEPSGKKIYTEMVPRTKDWYFMLRCGFFF